MDPMGLLLDGITCTDDCIKAMEAEARGQKKTVERLLDAASEKDCPSMKELKKKYNLTFIGSAGQGPVGAGKKKHECVKAVISYIEGSKILTMVTAVNFTNFWLNPFSDTCYCWSKTWAFAEAIRSKWYVSILQQQIRQCKAND